MRDKPDSLRDLEHTSNDAADLHFKLATTLQAQGKLEEALEELGRTVAIKPNHIPARMNLGFLLAQRKQYKEAVFQYHVVLSLDPSFIPAHEHLCHALKLANEFRFYRAACRHFVALADPNSKMRAKLFCIDACLQSGLHDEAKEMFFALEAELHAEPALSDKDIKDLYKYLLYLLPHLRDDPDANSRLARWVSSRRFGVSSPTRQFQTSRSDRRLKIGFMTSHFQRHSVAWMSYDIISALAESNADLHFYATRPLDGDDRTSHFEAIRPITRTQKTDVVETIAKDHLDVLIELDSLSVPAHARILNAGVAPLCISWLGFDAPFVSASNYFLGDRYTLPPGTEKHYLERLARLPDCYVAVKGFESIPTDRGSARRRLGIGDTDVAFLCVASGKKFNPEMAAAHAEILKAVPNSVLLFKDGRADLDVIRNAYSVAFASKGIDYQRLMHIPFRATEEEHRSIYQICDVVLDTYPYCGGTHTVESLWFNVPLVTLVGKQFSSRMGFTFLQNARVDEGIAWSWSEYIQWGIRLGRDSSLRLAVTSRLQEGKQPHALAPLWNPRKCANDLLTVLRSAIRG